MGGASLDLFKNNLFVALLAAAEHLARAQLVCGVGGTGIFLLVDESHFDKDWSISGKLINDKSKNIFMIFTGSSAINLEYNAEAARRMIRYPITPLNYSQHLKLKYNYQTDISNDLVDLLFNGNVDAAIHRIIIL